MSSFSITSNFYLRTLYAPNRSLATNSVRMETPKTTLSAADQSALRKGIKALADFDYENADNDSTTDKKNLYDHIKAFTDAYNNSVSTGLSSDEDSVRALTKRLKKATASYQDDLSSLGITANSDGYLSISSSAVTNISISKYEDFFGESSKFMDTVSDYSKRLSNRIDVSI